MRQLFRLLFTSALLIGAITSCQKDEGLSTGQIEFSILSQNLPGGRAASLTAILISVEDSHGKSIFKRKQLTLYSFGTEYLSEPIALTKGDFKLTEFIILDESNAAIYATPMEGTPLAYLVNDPLPIDFTVLKDQTTKVSPQVIKVDGNAAIDFGYVTFGLDIVNTFQFYVGVLAYNNQSAKFELTTSHLTITDIDATNSTKLFDKDEAAITNSVTVKDGYATYVLSVSKSGYITRKKTYTATELKAFVSGTPLVVTLMPQSLADSTLIAYYPFSGNAFDATQNHHDGIVHGGVALTTDRKGNVSAAYSFDGVDDYISVPHANDLNLPGDFTISLWTQISGSQNYSGVTQANLNDILRKWNGDAEGYPFAVAYLNPTHPTNPNQFIAARYDGQVCGNGPTVFSPTITTEVFHHYVLVKHGNTLSQYVDNQLAGEITDSTAGSACTVGNTADMTFAVRGNLYRFFKGKIDDVRIYKRAITTTEIANLYGE